MYFSIACATSGGKESSRDTGSGAATGEEGASCTGCASCQVTCGGGGGGGGVGGRFTQPASETPTAKSPTMVTTCRRGVMVYVSFSPCASIARELRPTACPEKKN